MMREAVTLILAIAIADLVFFGVFVGAGFRGRP